MRRRPPPAPRWSGRSRPRWHRAGGRPRGPPRAGPPRTRPRRRAPPAAPCDLHLQGFPPLFWTAPASGHYPDRAPDLLAVEEVDDVRVVVDDRQPDHDPAADQRRQYEEREEAGRRLLPEPTVGAQRRAEDEGDGDDQADRRGNPVEQVLVVDPRERENG